MPARNKIRSRMSDELLDALLFLKVYQAALALASCDALGPVIFSHSRY